MGTTITGAAHLVEQVGVFTPKSRSREQLSAGEVGFVISGIKELRDAHVGDTVTHAGRAAVEPLPGFKEVKSQVFAGLFPVEFVIATTAEHEQILAFAQQLVLAGLAALFFAPVLLFYFLENGLQRKDKLEK